jgi:hypothetical protein
MLRFEECRIIVRCRFIVRVFHVDSGRRRRHSSCLHLFGQFTVAVEDGSVRTYFCVTSWWLEGRLKYRHLFERRRQGRSEDIQ